MAEKLKKVRVQLLDTETNEVIEDVDVLTSASSVTFDDGSTLQEKANQGGFGYDDTAIRELIEGKADKATDLAGYGIENAYTKDEIDSKISSVYKYKGSKPNKESLPSDGNIIGDVWNLEDTGMNVAWTGSSWDDLGVTVDLSSYLTKDEAGSLYAQNDHTHDASQVTEDSTHRFVTDFEKETWNGKADNIKFGANLESGQQVKVFLKVVE